MNSYEGISKGCNLASLANVRKSRNINDGMAAASGTFVTLHALFVSLLSLGLAMLLT
jgi:hypothetical protein